jgi:hypothetical protein
MASTEVIPAMPLGRTTAAFHSEGTMTRIRTGLIAAAAAALLGATMPTAVAATARVHDPSGDARPRIDITSAAFHNRNHAVAGVINVGDLRRLPSRYSVSFSPLNSPDIAFIARTTRKDDGTQVDRLIFIDDLARHHVVACDLRVSWDFGADSVSIGAPRSCLKGISGTLFMGAQTAIPGVSHDRTRFRNVDQG